MLLARSVPVRDSRSARRRAWPGGYVTGGPPRKTSDSKTGTGISSELENVEDMPYLRACSPLFDARFSLWYTHRMDDPTENFPTQTYEPSFVDIPMVIEDAPLAVAVPQVVDISPEKNTPEKPALPPLSVDEDSFALAVVEYGGNVSLAYKSVFGDDVRSPGARGQALMALPQIQYRIQELTTTVKESAMVSMGMHLQELATIRDMAKLQGQLKIALQAERTRGEATGLYDKFEHGSKDKGPTNIQINLVSKYDVSI